MCEGDEVLYVQAELLPARMYTLKKRLGGGIDFLIFEKCFLVPA